MKFTVNRLLMYQAVKTVLKVVRPRREIPEIGGLLVEADGSKGILTITGTDVRTHIPVSYTHLWRRNSAPRR